jgi:hypothetical protein
MKNSILLPFFLIISIFAFSQTTPEPTTTTAKKTVQIAGKWYIETTTTTKTYIELTTDILLSIDNDTDEEKQDDAEIAQKQAEKLKRKAERQERNMLLKDALQKGYKPNPQTLEDQEKVKKAKAKLGIK